MTVRKTGVTARGGAPTVGIDLGGSQLRVGTVDFHGTVLAVTQEPTPADLATVLERAASLLEEVASGHDAQAVGCGAAGLVDRHGAVRFAPNLPQLVEVPLAVELERVLGLPVVVDNDANAAAWGELCHGAARGAAHALVVTLGTGVGGGIIVDGRLYRGAQGFAAEVGHMPFDPRGPRCGCGEVGHFETAASGTALGRLGRERARAGAAPDVLARAGGDASVITGVHVGQSALAGAPDGLSILTEFAESVGAGLGGLANILDPEIVVVSGGLVDLGEVLFAPLRAAFAGHLEGGAHRPVPALVEGALGRHAGVVGAAGLARELLA